MTNQLVKAPENKIQQSYTVLQDADGKFFRRGKYEAWASSQPQTEEEMIQLFNIMEGQDEEVVPMKMAVGKVLSIEDVYFNPYTSIDEDTGEEMDGVLTYIKSADTLFYATSSKTLYNTLVRAINMFGHKLNVKITSKKGQNGDIISCQVVSMQK